MNNILKKKERKIIFLFLFLPLTLLILFGIIPVIALVFYSFTSWNGLSTVKEFVGIENYIKIISEPKYFEAFINNIYYLISGLIQILIALFFAIMLSEKVKFKNFFKASFIFPSLVSGVAISMMFKIFFQPDGDLDKLLTFMRLEEHIRFWLGDPDYVNYSLASISIWRHTGISFLMYFGAIQAIPEEYCKVAQIEGANLIQKIRYVILPNIRTVLKINFILLIIGSISVFEIPLIMTNGSNGTTTFLLQTMKTAFDKKMVGLASAMAVIVTIVIITLTILQKKIYRKDNDEF